MDIVLQKNVQYLVVLALISFVRSESNVCLNVPKGSRFSSIGSDSKIAYFGINTDRVLFSLIKFEESAGRYLMDSSDPDGEFCSQAWNKLYGTSRCGDIIESNKDSDRFGWRRPTDCYEFNDGYLVREKENCSSRGLIELAALAYDNGNTPMEYPNQLLKLFKTKVKVNEWYGYRLTLEASGTLYELLSSVPPETEDASTPRSSSDVPLLSTFEVVETKFIKHRNCSAFRVGIRHMLYFGSGSCTAPQTVSACYANNSNQRRPKAGIFFIILFLIFVGVI